MPEPSLAIGDTAEALGVDLEELIVRKMAANRLRPHKHGKRA